MEDMPTKKQPLQLNWDTLLPKPTPTPELLAAADTHPPPVPERGDFCRISDVSIEKEIERQKCHLEKLHNLPDNGEKIRVRIRQLEAELEHRRFHHAIGDGSEKLTHSERENFTGASGDSMETIRSPLQDSHSEFCSLFNRKLDNKKDKRSMRRRQKSPLSTWKSPFRFLTKLSTEADKRTLSSDDQNGYCSRNYKKVSNNSSIKRQRPSPSLASKDSRQSNGNTYVLVDEEGPEPETNQAEEVDERLNDSKVYYYPARNDPESVEICYQDMQCLAPQAYISSTIMNFYIRHLQEPTLATGTRSTDYHFFNTYFYNKLQEAVQKKDEKEGSFSKLRRWWKGINIFYKAYILFPVHEDLHWSLVIICIPDKEDDSGPIILHLDSLGFHSSRSIFDNVKSFLIEEWKHLNKAEVPPDLPISNRIWKNLSRRIDEKRIQVPQQKNEYDCGLFVLYFIERFIVEAPERLRRKDLAMFGRKWFKPIEASNLRRKIKKLLEKEFRKATQDDQESLTNK